MSWRSRGSVTLHAAGLTFPILGPLPGAYRLQFVGRGRTRVYIGEAVNLQRRMGNYRRPGPRQRTSIRINELLNAHLDAGGTVELATSTEAVIVNAGVERAADLSLKRERVLVEHAALLVESGAEEIDVENRREGLDVEAQVRAEVRLAPEVGSQSGSGLPTREECNPVARADVSALGGTRTPNLLIRSQMLYPIELRALG